MLRSFLVCLAVLHGLIAASGASAAQRTFVSTSGSDANTASNCSNTLPCRGFTAALTVTDSGGEIIVLTSGGYGPVTINKSVSLIAPEGVYAGISVFSGYGITIATAGVNVVLRGLTINRPSGTGSGIYMTAGDSLVVQNCVLTNLTGNGLYVTTAALVRVFDSLFQGNYRGAGFSGGATAHVSGSRFIESGVEGLRANATSSGMVTRVAVGRSEASRNLGPGFYALASGGGRSEIYLKDSASYLNNYGVNAESSGGIALVSASNNLVSGNAVSGLSAYGSGAKLVASRNMVSHNGTGLSQSSSAVLQSTGDNAVTDNGAATSGTITSLANM